MYCQLCKKQTHTLETRIKENGVTRRRECLVCQHRFTTIETVITSISQNKPNPTPSVKSSTVPKRIKSPIKRLISQKTYQHSDSIFSRSNLSDYSVYENFGLEEDL